MKGSARNEASFRRGFSILLRTALTATLVAVVVFIGLVLIGAYYPNPNGYHPPIELVTVKMGDTVLRIPENYFWGSVHTQNENGQDPLGFNLLGLLPDIEPRTEKTAPALDRTGWHDQILILVEYKGHSNTGKTLLNIMYHEESEDKKITKMDGYNMFTILGGEVLFSGSLEKPLFFIQCDPNNIPRGLTANKWSPSCSRTVSIGKNIYIDYIFSRSHLAQVHLIEKHVISLLNQFRTSGPELEAAQ